MPAWGMHLLIAKKLNKKLKLDYNEFTIGNLLPDIYSGWIIEDASKILEYKLSHYGKIVKINNHDFMLPDYEEFIKSNNVKGNSIAIGYLCHILSDYFFNQYAFELKYIKNDDNKVVAIRNKTYAIVNANNDTARQTKQNDFNLYANQILLKNKFKKISINKDVIEKSKEIRKIDVEESDLLKMQLYVEKMLTNKNIEKANEDMFEMFSMSELDNMIDMCVNFIMVVLKEKSLI